jgi:hypothetical protein
MKEIRQMKTKWETHSYGGKHEVEKYRDSIPKTEFYQIQGTYISNGEFIMAMILCGYEPKVFFRGRSVERNCLFKAKLRKNIF